MKFKRVPRAMGLAALAILASPAVAAENTGWYMGGNIGQSEADIDDERITRSLMGAGFTTTDDDDSDLGYKLFGGYQYNRNFAVEGGYFDLGEYDFTASNGTGTLGSNMRVKGVNLDLVGIVPFTEKFSGFGRFGAAYAEVKNSYSGTGTVTAPPDSKDRDWNPKLGLGLQYDFNESWGMRTEVERYRIKDAVGDKGDIDLVSLGLVYRFGAKAPVVAAAPEPVYVAPAPPPRPMPPPRPAPKKVTFSADALFDFDQATLKPAGKQALDAFAADLKGIDYDVITVTGHTDRIGSDAYNMRLSTRRAEVVRDYLVDAAGVPAGKMTGRGMGESEPVTKPGECSEARTPENIACLQPDRRVEVEVTGTR